MNLISNNMNGYTFQELMDNSCKVKKLLDEGKFPIEGTTKDDYMIIGDLAIYKPFIPLQITPELKSQYKK